MEEIKSSNLVKKLKELGYRKMCSNFVDNIDIYTKNYLDVMQVICIDSDYEVLILNYYIKFDRNITSQKDLDNIQIAFNRLQSDIKVLYGTDAD